MKMYQGDIIKMNGFKNRRFVIVSKNSFIEATGVFHVCPVLENIKAGPLHIEIKDNNSSGGTVICEQIKLIDPSARGITRLGNMPYPDIMNVSDALQGIFEYG